MDKDIKTLYFSIHDMNLRLITGNGLIASSISEYLGYFKTKEISGLTDLNISLSDIEEDVSIQLSIPPDSGLLYAPSDTDMFDMSMFGFSHFDLYADKDGSTYYVDLGDLGIVSYNPNKGTANGYIQILESIHSNVASRTLLMFVLDKLLEARGCFRIHCSAVEKDGKGILFPGFSGAGKTTACIALIRQGYGFLGDDRPFLRYGRNGGMEILSFPDYIDVTNETIDLFPELKEEDLLKENRHLRKKSFYADDLYPGSIKTSCAPRAILYPEISGGKESYLEELSKSETLKSLLPHSMLVFDKDIAKRHFDILFDLVKAADCYKLKFGSNIDNLPDLIESIL